MSCLEEETVLGFVEGRLDHAGLARVEAHARECVSCDELIGAAFSRPADTGGGPAPGPIERGTGIGRYTVIDLVGVGGMSEVYAAHDPELDRKIALKVMRPRWSAHPADDARHENRLAQEAQATARLRHPNVISVHDVGTFGARVFIAMEYVDGQTLSAWLNEGPRSWREIVAVFLDAARGLAAAHAGGIVHRDFKPQNVMVGRDGLVRVMDFGLARRIDDGSLAGVGVGVGEGGGGGEGLSGAPEIVGTPRFMSPEQTRGEVTDARSDQFSFCVALDQALRARAAVPGWLRRVVRRGLAVDRADRWPSMDDLVSALSRATANRGRWVAVVAGLALGCAMVGSLAFAALNPSTRQDPGRCREGPRRLSDAWTISRGARDAEGGSPVRARVLAAFQASKLRSAGETWDRVSVLLDRYAGEWSAMYRDACEAEERMREVGARAPAPAPDLLGLRTACLEDSRVALQSLTGLLGRGDDGVVANAIDAVHALPALDRCTAASLQHAVGAPKATPEVAARAADVRRRAMAAREAFDTGDHLSAIAEEARLLEEARRLGFTPLVAEMLLLLGSQQTLSYQPGATETLREAAQAAVRAKRDDIAAEAYELLGGAAVLTNHADEARIWLDLGEAMVDRIGEGQDPRSLRLRAWLLQDRANARVTAGQYEEAEPLYEQALALKKRVLAFQHPDIARTMASQAENLHRMGRNREALALDDEALQLFQAIYGPHSPVAAACLSNRGEYLMAVGANEEALSTFRRALDLWEGSIGPQNSLLGYPLTGIGQALIALGRPAEAVGPLERAARIRQGDDVEPALKAETGLALGEARRATGQRARQRARTTTWPTRSILVH